MLDPHAPPFPATVHPQARPARRLTWDSRKASPDVAFVALPGEAMHGNRFVQSALDAGAPFVIFWPSSRWHQKARLPESIRLKKMNLVWGFIGFFL